MRINFVNLTQKGNSTFSGLALNSHLPSKSVSCLLRVYALPTVRVVYDTSSTIVLLTSIHSSNNNIPSLWLLLLLCWIVLVCCKISMIVVFMPRGSTRPEIHFDNNARHSNFCVRGEVGVNFWPRVPEGGDSPFSATPSLGIFTMCQFCTCCLCTAYCELMYFA